MALLAFLAACSGPGSTPATEPAEGSESGAAERGPAVQPAEPDPPQEVCVVGDFTGQGTDELAAVRQIPGGGLRWRLPAAAGASRELTTPGAGPILPIVGDWDGDGRDDPGTFSGGHWTFAIDSGDGDQGTRVHFGLASDLPVVGDWDGDGRDSFGVFRDGAWFLKNEMEGSDPDLQLGFGLPGDVPLVGDWDGDGVDSLGVRRDEYVFLCDDCRHGEAQHVFPFGAPGGGAPVAIDHDGDGRDRVGLVTGPAVAVRFELGPGTADLTLTCAPDAGPSPTQEPTP